MKKFIALVLATLMCAALLTGCGSTGTSSTASTQAADAIHKIGVIFYGKDDDLGQCVYAEINHAAEVIGVEVEWALGDYDTESQLTSVEI